jgi:hypothetical protein
VVPVPQFDIPVVIDLCGCPHRWIYVDAATMPRVLVVALIGVMTLVFFVV